MKLEYLVKIADGKPQNYIFKKLSEEMATLKNGRYWLKVTPVNTRTEKQNSFLHLLFDIFSREVIQYTGDKMYTPELMKDMMKQKFLTKDVVDTTTGEVVGQFVKHTADLNKEEMSIFLEDIFQEAVQRYNVVLPRPNTEFDLNLDFNRADDTP